MPKPTRRALLLAPLAVPLATGLASCASPDPNFYTLSAVPGASVPGGPRLVELRRIGLAGYLDRPEIVRNAGPYSLKIPAGERWGEPFGDMVARVLAEDLSSRMPGTSVFTSAGAISATADATVELDLQRFDADATGTVTLLAQAAVSRGRRTPARTEVIRLTVQPAGPGTTALVAAMSGALGQLADRLGPLLRTA